MIFLPDAEPHDRIFIRLDKTPECDGRTDRRTESLWLFTAVCVASSVDAL